MIRAKPIETQYKGYRFRSRLEARWAIFLDHLGVAWNYEIEGYEQVKTHEIIDEEEYHKRTNLHQVYTPDGKYTSYSKDEFSDYRRRYLPDFFIPSWNSYLEIKPAIPLTLAKSEDELAPEQKVEGRDQRSEMNSKFDVAIAAKKEIYFVAGDPCRYDMFRLRSRIVPDSLKRFAMQLSDYVDPFHLRGEFYHVPGKEVPQEILIYEEVLGAIIRTTKDLQWHDALKGVGHTRRWRDMWEGIIGSILSHDTDGYMFFYDPCNVFRRFYSTEDINEASKAACSARFEFGEKP